MAFVYMHIFSLTFAFKYESFIIECYPAGVSNKHCLLSLFSFLLISPLKPTLLVHKKTSMRSHMKGFSRRQF